MFNALISKLCLKKKEVRTAVRTTLYCSILLFHDEKAYTARNFRRKFVEIKAAEPCAIEFWEKKRNLKIEEINEKNNTKNKNKTEKRG